MKILRLTQLLALFLVLVVLAACTTQKRRDDQSMLSKLWHNTTAHYNGYFNAEELLEASVLQLEQQHQDNYNQVLDMYEYVAVDNPQAVAPDLDEAIKKVTVVVNLHPYSNWTDDCYLLAGKADYLKQDYESAEKTFRYLINEFSPQDLKEGPKERTTKKKKGTSKKERAKNKKEKEKTAKNKKKERIKAAKERAKERDRQRKQDKKERAQYLKAVKKARKNGTKAPPRPGSQRTKTEENEAEQPATEEEKPEEEDETDEEEPRRPGGMITLGQGQVEQIESDPENYFLKHRPAYQEGVYWLARTLIERDNFDGAGLLLNQLEQDKSTFKDVRQEVIAAQAYLAIQRRDYDAAVSKLDQAIAEADARDRRARYAYIKAQLHQRRSESGEAYAAFEQVIKSKPDYVMEFGARLNMAQNAWLSGQGSVEDAKRNLEKMLGEEKNANYRDQIYYALADIALQQNEREEGIALLRKSLSASVSNKSQKAEAYYRLGNLYFETDDFISAKYYYDSTLMVMGPNDERYVLVENYRDNLTDIAENLQVIALQDSLLRIAKMSESEKRDLAQKILEERQAEQAATAAVQPPRNPLAPPVARPALQKESSFFAYNDRAVRRGERVFQEQWGDRPLEDNWRRSNRQDVGGFDEIEDIAEVVPEITDEELSKVLADVPTSDAEVATAELLIKEAMFDLGRLYRDRLENNKRSVDILEQLDTRFPKNLHELESWYYLYLGHTDLGNTSKANTYKQKIGDRYPTSHFAKMLNDPNYAAEFLSEERRLAREYDNVYSMFQDGQYEMVYSRSEQAISALQGQHTLKPKYALLRAMSLGSVEGKDAYVKELRKLVASYPETPEQTRAKEILRLLGEAGARLPGEVAPAVQSEYVAKPEELHYILVVFRDGGIDLNANKIAVSNYNRKYHKLDKIRISNVYLGEKNDVPVLVMRRFKNQDEAMRYYDGVTRNGADFITGAENAFDMYPITQSNYSRMLKARSTDGYAQFFREGYLDNR